MPALSSRSKKFLTIATVCCVAAVLLGISIGKVNAQPVTIQKDAIVASGGTSSRAVNVVGSRAPMLEVHISNNGLILLRGARIVSVSGNTLKAEMLWGSVQFVWEIHIDSSTKFFSVEGAKENIDAIGVGDIVEISEALIQGGDTPIIAGQFVRE